MKPTRLENTVIAGDCEVVLRKLPTAFFNLAFVDPNFNKGKEYLGGCNDNRPRSVYLAQMERWLAAVKRVLRPDGSIFVAISSEYAAEFKLMLDRLGLTQRNWLTWYYTFGVACTRKFSRSGLPIHYYTMNPKRFTFNADDIRIPSDRLTIYRDKRANPRGKIPDDVWTFNRVCGTHKERTRKHPCQMPVELLERIIRAASNPGDLVLDPCCGSGTTLVAAKKLGRRFLGIELSAQYADVARQRLASIQEVA